MLRANEEALRHLVKEMKRVIEENPGLDWDSPELTEIIARDLKEEQEYTPDQLRLIRWLREAEQLED